MSRKKMKLNLPKPVSIREKVYKAIREDVLNGRIAHGERIVEAKIAREINTSRTPVREALHMLEREGFLEVIPRVGYRLKTIEKKDLEDLCEIRIVNETLSVQWAIDHITAKELKNLRENLEQSEIILNKGDAMAFVDKDAEFHEILSRASGSHRLYKLCKFLYGHMMRYRIETAKDIDTARDALSGHQLILENIINKDKEAAEKSMREHLEGVKHNIVSRLFPDMGEF